MQPKLVLVPLGTESVFVAQQSTDGYRKLMIVSPSAFTILKLAWPSFIETSRLALAYKQTELKSANTTYKRSIYYITGIIKPT